jgi:hypothetical protein
MVAGIEGAVVMSMESAVSGLYEALMAEMDRAQALAEHGQLTAAQLVLECAQKWLDFKEVQKELRSLCVEIEKIKEQLQLIEVHENTDPYANANDS